MKRARAGVLALAAVLFLWNLWGYDLWAPDEPYFAEGAREMVEDGRWAVPHVNGKVTTDKPPLFFWSIAATSLPFGGVTPLTARLPSALSALGTLLLVLWLGRRLLGERAALLGALLLASAHLFWDQARSCQIDAMLCLLITVALTAFAAWRAGLWSGRRGGLLFWAAAALAVLAKGPVGLLLPLGVALATLAWDRSLGRWREFAPLAGPGLFLLMVAAWIGLATLGGGGEYSVWGALKEHALDRAVKGMHHRQPPWYYLMVLPPRLLPWTPLLPGALLLGWRRRREPAFRFLMTAFLFVVLFFSISTEKRTLYVLPALPALALLMGALLDGWWDGGGRGAVHRRWTTWPFAVLGAPLLALGLAAVVTMARGADVGAELAARGGLDPAALGSSIGPALVALAAVLLLGGAAMLVGAFRARPRTAVLGAAATLSAVYLVAVTLAYPALDEARSARALSLAVAARTADARAAGETVAAYRTGNLPEALSFYTGGVYFDEIGRRKELVAQLGAGDAEGWIVAERTALDRLPPEITALYEEVLTARVSRRVYTLVRRAPPP